MHFEKLTKKWSPEYFIVADLEDFDRQKDLKDFLTDRFDVIAESDKYLIFDLTKEARPEGRNNPSSADG